MSKKDWIKSTGFWPDINKHFQSSAGFLCIPEFESQSQSKHRGCRISSGETKMVSTPFKLMLPKCAQLLGFVSYSSS